MSSIVELHNRWRGFAADRAKARREVDAKIEANNSEIERLRAENIELNTEFTEHWAKTKKELQEARDRAVMDAMAEGMSGQQVLRELGSRNTVWIYDLRKRLAAEGRLPATLNENSPIEQLQQAKAREPAPDPITWLTHPSLELAGWSISDDFDLIKRERRGGAWFICGPDNEFMRGDKSFYESTGKDTIGKQADLLMARLEEAESA
jgi:CheY-like chemotaxis protein